MRTKKSLLKGLPFFLGAALVLPACLPAARAAQSGSNDQSLLDLSIEELLHVEITSAAKKSQRISETAAAAFVITQDDIKRSGARNIPEILRMVPGLEVAQIDANKWAVTARGFNGRFANKLLVLMDGRTLYSPSFSGVFWDVQDTLMSDIERIEIIRGPGGTLWGANAVNGVINIITRSSRETPGGELIADAATGPSRTGSLRYGGSVDDGLTYRAYAKYLDEAGNEDAAGRRTSDDFHIGRVGARADWHPDAQNQLSLTGEAYRGRMGETLARPLLDPPYSETLNADENVSGAFAVGNWHRQFGGGRELQAQAYYDETHRDALLFGEQRRSAVLDVQYHLPVGSHQDVVTGAGLRSDTYRFAQTDNVTVTPENPTTVDYNVFGQDEIQLLANRLALTVGVDLEHNPLSENSVDALPSGRLLWTINDANHLWGAVTKAISTPSYEDTGAYVRYASPVAPPGAGGNPFPVPLVVSVVGNPKVGSEKLVAYELGLRTQPSSTLTLDGTIYRHDYRQLRGEVTTAVYCDPSKTPVAESPQCLFTATSVVDQLQFLNAERGHSTGFELAADWLPVSRLRLHAAYTFMRLQLAPTLADPILSSVVAMVAGQSPRQQFSVRSELSISHNLDLNVAVRHVDALPYAPVPAYWSADTNVTWRVGKQLEFSLTGRNLLQPGHLEFVSELSDVVPTRIERTVAARVRWAF
jgi:iron complex outermembrane recepter protein